LTTRSSAAAAPEAIDLALRLTLLDLILRPVGNWAVRPLLLGLAAVGLLRPAWLRAPSVWLVLAALAGARVALDWPLADNHAYLLAYWCLAAALALLSKEPNAALAGNARLLVGLVFAFACIWKFVLSDDYLNGTFFQITLLTDPRFEGFTQILGGLDLVAIEQLRAVLERHRDAVPGDPGGGVVLPAGLVTLAAAATWWNLAINAAIAVAFLWPFRGWPGARTSANLRHVLLLVYCVVTYAIATVDGFGWLLLAMGAAQCHPSSRCLRGAYIGAFVLILVYREVPWADQVILPVLQLSAAR
jgi:hypothetical protein